MLFHARTDAKEEISSVCKHTHTQRRTRKEFGGSTSVKKKQIRCHFFPRTTYQRLQLLIDHAALHLRALLGKCTAAYPPVSQHTMLCPVLPLPRHLCVYSCLQCISGPHHAHIQTPCHVHPVPSKESNRSRSCWCRGKVRLGPNINWSGSEGRGSEGKEREGKGGALTQTALG